MIALILATLEEAKPFLTRLPAAKIAATPFATFQFGMKSGTPSGILVISGMGPDNAAAATDYAIVTRGASVVINPGICGAIDESLPPAHLFHISEVSDGDAVLLAKPGQPVPLPATAWSELPAARLATVKEPVFGGTPRALLEPHADLVDMEGYAVASACRKHGIPCHLLKGVSDHADEAGRETLQRNLARVSESLADEVIKQLPKLDPPGPGLIARMADFVKIEHTIFILPLLFAGAWIGAGGHWPGWRLLFLITCAGLGARSLGMAMNRILDARLDKLNPRTAARELPSGRMTPAMAWGIAATGLAVYLLACAALGPVCLKLSPYPALVLISYSLLKRFSCLCHFGIGLSLAFGPLGAFVAVSGGTEVTAPIILLTLFTFCWISGFDIIYALQDIEADRRNGVHSIPAALGFNGAQFMALIVHLVAAAAAIQLWRVTNGGLPSGLALSVTLLAFCTAYYQKLPLPVRFFPVSAIAGIAASLIPLLGGLR
ncbi:MAG: UbiA-like polyprenyltransferase [bacterium]